MIYRIGNAKICRKNGDTKTSYPTPISGSWGSRGISQLQVFPLISVGSTPQAGFISPEHQNQEEVTHNVWL